MALDDGVDRNPAKYDVLINSVRHRPSRVIGRYLEEETDADRGRVLFCPAFRRLQNKAQVFSLETNASIRSRLTHSLEVSSIGRYVAQQALKSFSHRELLVYGLEGKERPIITIVETACLLHDIGNPPFGHFGEIAISDWFHQNADKLRPDGIGGPVLQCWNKYYNDFRHFDGNPQGFRIVSKLQAKEHGDLSGMNLTASTLAAIMKYPWSSESIGEDNSKKKSGYYQTESDVVEWVRKVLQLDDGQRHPLVYLMEAADDIAYCLSDIEDGFEKGLISSQEFARDLRTVIVRLLETTTDEIDKKELIEMDGALCDLEGVAHGENPHCNIRFDAMDDFRSSFIRYYARHAGIQFREFHIHRPPDRWTPLLREFVGSELLDSVRKFAENRLYTSNVVRDRELTAHAVLSGLLNAYMPLMTCNQERFTSAISGNVEDGQGRKITGEQSLISRMPIKYMAVYKEEVKRLSAKFAYEGGMISALERIHRIRLIVDFVSGMTDEYALQTFKLVSGIDTARY
jgi:dGTPase